MSPALKFELRMAPEVRVYKIRDLVYKIVQNKYKIMIYFSFSKFVFGLGGGGDMHLISRNILVCSRNITKTFENYFENFQFKFLKISRIIADNFENYIIEFQKISKNTSDIFDKYFSESFEKYFEKYRKLFRKYFRKNRRISRNTSKIIS